MKKDSSNSSSFSKFIIWLKKKYLLFKKRNRLPIKVFSLLLQSIQLSIIYFLAFMNLFYSVTVILGQVPVFFEIVVPAFIEDLIRNPAVRAALAPERTYFIYLFIFEFIIFRSIFGFSKLVKYNLLLIFTLEMLQNLAMGYWDVICNRQYANESYTVDLLAATLVITFIHIVLFFIYIYSYFYAVRGKYTQLPGMDWLTDSIGFWLRLRTPGMGKK